MQARPRLTREELLEIASDVVLRMDEQLQASSVEVLEGVEELRPDPGDGLGHACDRAYALGWIQPRLTDAVMQLEGNVYRQRLLVACGLLGLTRRLNDLVAVRLSDDPRFVEPTNQMLAARLADQDSLASGLEITVESLCAGADADTANGAAPAATLAMAFELARASATTAYQAAGSDDSRERVADRSSWLADLGRDGSLFRLFDEVASDLEGHPTPR